MQSVIRLKKICKFFIVNDFLKLFAIQLHVRNIAVVFQLCIKHIRTGTYIHSFIFADKRVFIDIGILKTTHNDIAAGNNIAFKTVGFISSPVRHDKFSVFTGFHRIKVCCRRTKVNRTVVYKRTVFTDNNIIRTVSGCLQFSGFFQFSARKSCIGRRIIGNRSRIGKCAAVFYDKRCPVSVDCDCPFAAVIPLGAAPVDMNSRSAAVNRYGRFVIERTAARNIRSRTSGCHYRPVVGNGAALGINAIISIIVYI